MRRDQWVCCLAFLFLMLTAEALWAIDPPDRSSGVGQKAFRHSDLEISNAFQSPSEFPPQAAAALQQQLAALGLSDEQGRLDRRGGRWVTLLFAHPLLPGSGVGNSLSWPAGPPRNDLEYQRAAWNAFKLFLEARAARLRINPNELARSGKVTVQQDGALVQIHVPRQIDGIPVRGTYLSATINHGNLVLFGAHNWGPINRSMRPELSQEDALASLETYLDTFVPSGSWGPAELNIVPMARGQNIDQVAVGQGYAHRLAWVLRVTFSGDVGRWEALVDAQSGEVLSFEDTNHYAEVTGGVYPVTNDGIGSEGVEQARWPMPYQDTSLGRTDTGGNVPGSGSITATFSGDYVNMNDNCGTDSLTQNDNIDWGTSGGSDCATPGFGGAGNTHASRTGFYELNKIIEMARGQLPSNSWLQQRLTANMNINNTCNAFYNGSTVNFYRSGGGCANTGEIAAVFDHEWGHGLDDHDATPGIASPSGEGIADIYTALRLNNSCIGRGFRPGVMCSGSGDPCLECDGVRDIDYEKHQSGQPHDYSWSNANCGGQVHCVGAVYAEAVWSLWKRWLQSAPYNYDNNTAHEIVTRLTFIGAGNTGTWFSGGPPDGGCAGNSGYMNYLAADDDNGNLNDGTPHMRAIFGAFNEQEIACNTPTVQDSGCADTPTMAPTVQTGNGNQLVTLDWDSVPNATEYEVFRTEGVFACDFGKVKLGKTPNTSWTDTGLQNGRDYSYVVIPKGTKDSCFGPASACATVAPVGEPDFAVSCSPPGSSIAQGTSAQSTCTVISRFGYNGSVDLSCAGNPAGIGCSFAPSSVSLPADGSAESTLTMDVAPTQALGTYNFDVVGYDGSVTRSSQMTVVVRPEGQEGPQTAVFDQFMGAPTCYIPGSSCDSGTLLLDSRGNLSPAEPNQPNSLDACTDGSGGSYHDDESNDRIVVRTLDGFDFAEGATVEVEATVWAWVISSWDAADFYYTADADNPSWTYITTIIPPGAGAQTLTAQYTLPAGDFQAVRVNYRFSGSASSCSGGDFDDTDDLVFAVASGGGGCAADADCDNGLFCDGAETCSGGSCQPGTPIDCNDSVDCTVDSCNEGTDSCDNVPDDAVCDDGLFCNGAETCDPVLDCQPGSPPCSGSSCDETNDSCEEPPASCGNNICDPGEDCNNCSNDCISGTSSGAVCGNGICEAGDGEDCVSCPADCNGIQNGNPSGRFCCGDGDGQNPRSCGDSLCGSSGWSCTDVPQPSGSYCCGNNSCEGAEDGFNCELDCGPPPVCGNNTTETGEVCDGTDLGGETCISLGCNGGTLACQSDCSGYDTWGCTDCQQCVPTHSKEKGPRCSDGIDNDCDGLIDGADPDC